MQKRHWKGPALHRWSRSKSLMRTWQRQAWISLKCTTSITIQWRNTSILNYCARTRARLLLKFSQMTSSQTWSGRPQWRTFSISQNFPTKHEMYDQINARVSQKIKDEMGGKTSSEFVGLKPKLYSIKLADGLSNFPKTWWTKKSEWVKNQVKSKKNIEELNLQIW